MDTRLIAANPAEVETECLVAFVLDHGSKDANGKDWKSEPRLALKDAALEKAVADVFASGEFTGKAYETVVLHRPQGLKAKRLMLIGAGKAKPFSHAEVRRAAGTAIRSLKPKMIKSCAFVIPELSTGAEDAVRSILEGALVADFDPDTYRSDRKDLSMKDITVVAPPSADHGCAASHIVFHFFHAVGGLDGDAAGIKGDAFANEAEHRFFRRALRFIAHHDQARFFVRALGNAPECSHL